MPDLQKSQLQTILKDLAQILSTPVPGLELLDNINPFNGVQMKRKRKRAKNKEGQAGIRAFTLNGRLREGKGTPFAVDGEDFVIGPNTWILGEVEIGALAKVKGYIRGLGEREATSIVVSNAAGKE